MADVMDVLLTDLVQRINCRIDYHENEMVELMTSMRVNGLLSPIGIRPDKSNDKWEVVFGNRRFLAAKKLGWKKIPCIFVEAATKSRTDMLIVNSTENMVRSEPSLIEMAMVYKELLAEGLTRSEIAARMGVGVDRVKRALEALRTIPAEHHSKIKAGNTRKKGAISAAIAVRIEKMKKREKLTATQARDLYAKLSEGELTTAKAHKLLSSVKGDKSEVDLQKKAANLRVVILTLHCSKKVFAKHGFTSTVQANEVFRKLITRAYPGLLL